MSLVAVVVVGARRGVDVLTPIGGVPMVVRAVQCLLDSGVLDSGLAGPVVLLDAGGGGARLREACVGLPVQVHDGSPHALLPVRPHAGERQVRTGGDALPPVRADDVVLVHDAARPLAPPALARAVVAAVAAGRAMAVPVLPLTDTVKQVDGHGTVRTGPDRAGLVVTQTPFAVLAGLLTPELMDDLLGLPTAYAATGGTVHTVPGHPRALPVRSAWDLRLAELLVEGIDS